MALDLIIRNARLASAAPDASTVDIGIQNGRIVALESKLAADGPVREVADQLGAEGERLAPEVHDDFADRHDVGRRRIRCRAAGGAPHLRRAW